MSDFCPDGYVPTQEAIVRAAEYWFPDEFAALESAAAPDRKRSRTIALMRRCEPSRSPRFPTRGGIAFEEIASQTVHRLRNFLHQGNLRPIISEMTAASQYHASSGPRRMPTGWWSRAPIGRSASQPACMSRDQIIRCSCCNRNWMRY